jgi:hypothetical protein
MTIPVKVECECGQHYAFDVESDVELQPDSITCPACGVDGTVAANAIIAQSLAAQSTAANVPAKPRIRITAAPPSTPPTAPPPPPPIARSQGNAPGVGQTDRTQAEHEARAKILWGDPPEEVIKFLMFKGFSHEEASGKVRALFRERLNTVRATGIQKILMGIFMAVGAASTFLLLVRAGFISVWILAAAGLACVSGLWMILTGALKVLAPKSEIGDASEND